ncbi:MAG: hypothetical protein ACFE9L_12220 [Candidatus Hodarchaeota archaeon]
MKRHINARISRKIGFIFIIFLNINIIFSSSSVIAFNINYNLKTNDFDPILLDTTVIDYYGNKRVIRGKLGALEQQKITTNGHPLTGDASVVLKLEELGIIQPNSAGWILEDQLHGFTESIVLPVDTHFTSGIEDIATGQFDNDAEEEFIVADLDGNVVIYDDANHSYTEKYYHKFPAATCSGQCDSGEVHYENDIAIGDFDGEGLDEFAIVLTEWDYDDISILDPDCDNYDSSVYLYVFDPVDNNQTFSWYWYWTNKCEIGDDSGRSDHIYQPKLAAGELDGDGQDEIVLTTGGPAVFRGWVFEYSKGTYEERMEYRWDSDQDPYYSRNSNNFILSDIDADRRDEIIYIVKESGKQGLSIRIKDDEINQFREIRVININEGGFFHQYDWEALLESGDVDGDGFDEILTFSRVSGKTFGIIYDDIHTNFTVIKTWQPTELANIVGKELILGDIDADGMDEIIFSVGKGEEIHDIFFGLTVGSGSNILDDAKHNYAVLLSDATRKGFITTGDFDGDGIKLKYTGKHWTTTAPPKVIMTIAAPPTYWGISHNYAGSYTAFGEETSEGKSEGNSIGVSEGSHWSVGAKAGIKIKLFEAEASYKFTKSITEEMMRTNTKTYTEVSAQGYIVGSSANAVIYHRTVFDNYQYEIIYHPTDPEMMGEYMTIDVPQTPRLWKVTTSYYNAKYASIAPRIGKETFNHTVGKPWTYPNSSTLDSIASVRWAATQIQTVGLGDGAQTTSIRIEEEETQEMSRTFTTEQSHEFEASMGIGGEYGGFYATAGGGWSSASINAQTSAVSVGEACVYEGSVGDIENNNTFDKLAFAFSLFVYNLERSDENMRYQVVNYYVENASVYKHPLYDINQFISNVGNFFSYFPEISLAIAAVVVLTPTFLIIRRIRRRGRKKS